MNAIILEGPQGQREVIAGVPYQLLPGEKIVGAKNIGPDRADNKKLQELANAQGMGVGDLVAKLTKAFGIKSCSACEKRKKILNQLRINNWKITKEEK